MNCPKCQLIEMRVDKVEEEKIYYECKSCGEQKVIDAIELEEKE
jgi:predicted RNA-binding Zn-ribbon protein involved in translation (DUF1610 family)